jgi:hypothetical protein
MKEEVNNVLLMVKKQFCELKEMAVSLGFFRAKTLIKITD